MPRVDAQRNALRPRRKPRSATELRDQHGVRQLAHRARVLASFAGSADRQALRLAAENIASELDRMATR